MRVPLRAAVAPLVVAIATACGASRNAATVVRADSPKSAVSGAPAGTSAPAAADVDAALVREGYRVVRRHDQILYCRSESVTGTLFASTVCFTASQIANQRRDLQESKDLLKQSGATRCVGPECVGK
jgi:hypothetical protein